MQGVIISFLIGNASAIFFGVIIYKMIIQAKVPEMISEEKQKYIKDLEFENAYKDKQLRIANKERDIAIDDAQRALTERNEALIMLSQRFEK